MSSSKNNFLPIEYDEENIRHVRSVEDKREIHTIPTDLLSNEQIWSISNLCGIEYYSLFKSKEKMHNNPIRGLSLAMQRVAFNAVKLAALFNKE